MRKNVALFLFLAILFVLVLAPSSVLAQSASTQISLPPTAEGPGLILPDSPFYFLDKLKQQVRLLFAVTPVAKAQTYASIAGERLAEVRFELQKGNTIAAEVALQGLQINTALLGQEVAKAQFIGFDTKKLSEDLNTTIAQRQVILLSLANQASGGLKAQTMVTQAQLAQTKAIVEKGLPKDEMISAIRDDLVTNAAQFATDTAMSARELKASLDILQVQATDATANNMKAMQVVLQQAIAQKDIQLQKTTAEKLLLEKQRNDLSGALNAQAQAQAEDLVTKAQAVADTVKISQTVTTADATTVLGISQHITPTPIQSGSTSTK